VDLTLGVALFGGAPGTRAVVAFIFGGETTSHRTSTFAVVSSTPGIVAAAGAGRPRDSPATGGKGSGTLGLLATI